MKRSARAIATLSLLSVFASCSDGTSPSTIEIIERFERMAVEAGRANDPSRNLFLLRVAAMLRFGAPISTITIEEAGEEREYQAVTVQWSVTGSVREAQTTLYAWRGAAVDSRLMIEVFDGFASFPPADSGRFDEDSTAFIGNLVPAQLHNGDSLWVLQSGNAAASQTLDRGLCRPVASPTIRATGADLTCRRTRLDWSINAGLVGSLPVELRNVTSSILMRRQTVEGIHLLLDCPTDCSTIVRP